MTRLTLPQVRDRLLDSDPSAPGIQRQGWDLSNGRVLAIDINGLDVRTEGAAPALLGIWTAYTGIAFEIVEPDDPFAALIDPGLNEDADIGTYAPDADTPTTRSGTGSIIEEGNIASPFGQASFDFSGRSIAPYLFHQRLGFVLGLNPTADTDAGGDPVQGFENDTVGLSVMSQFFQAIDGQTIEAAPITPMPADLAAIEALYGPLPEVNRGATVYGRDGNAEGIVGDFLGELTGTRQAPTYVEEDALLTIRDSSGRDTFDFRGTTLDQLLDLRPGATSFVAGRDNFIATSEGVVTIAADTVIERAIAGQGDDTLTGNVAPNWLSGQGGQDLIRGGPGDDILLGNAGRDRLNGDNGDDTLIGGLGRDTMLGGAGDDVFRILSDHASAPDRILGWEAGAAGARIDRLDFTRHDAWTGFESVTLAPSAGGVSVSLGDDTVLIEGARLSDIDADSFV